MLRRVLVLAVFGFLLTGCAGSPSGERASEEPLEPEHESPEIDDQEGGLLDRGPDYEVLSEQSYDEPETMSSMNVEIQAAPEDGREAAEHVAGEHDDFDSVTVALHDSPESVEAQWPYARATMPHTEAATYPEGPELGELDYWENQEEREGFSREDALDLARTSCQLEEMQQSYDDPAEYEAANDEMMEELYEIVENDADDRDLGDLLEDRGYEGC